MRKNDAFRRAAALMAALSITVSLAAPAFAGIYYIDDGDITIEKNADGSQTIKQNGVQVGMDADGDETIITTVGAATTTLESDLEGPAAEDSDFGPVVEDNYQPAAPAQPEDADQQESADQQKDADQPEGADQQKDADQQAQPQQAAPAAAAAPAAPTPKNNKGNGFWDNTITVINNIAGTVLNLTLKDVKIDVSNWYEAAMSIQGKGDVELELDGKNELRSGGCSAGLEKNDDISEGNLIINDKDNNGELTALGGFQSAGIGGGQDKNSSNIIINGGTIVAKGGYEGHWGGSGAGIGGGGAIDRNSNRGNGSNITINGGNITATGGGFAAGIGGGCFGDGSNITVNGGIVNAASNIAGAGIGGGDAGGNGNNITITGGTVTATGKSGGAGIGGGPSGNGKDIAISGGTVTAIGGESGGAGIGGGANGNGSNITISGDVQITVEVKQGFDIEGNATAGTIGSGTKGLGSGEEIQPDISGLYTNSYIHHIIYDTDGVTIIKEWWEYGTVTPPAPEDETADTETFPLHVDDLFGNTLSYTTTRDGATLTVTVGDAFARLHGTLSALEELRAQGVESIVFATAMQTTTVSVADLLAQNSPDTEFAVEHVGVISRVLLGGDAVALACQQR